MGDIFSLTPFRVVAFKELTHMQWHCIRCKLKEMGFEAGRDYMITDELPKTIKKVWP